MDKRLLLIGVFLVIFGAILFLQRGFFAENFLGARVLGNMGLQHQDGEIIKNVSIGAGFIAIVGVILSISSVKGKGG